VVSWQLLIKKINIQHELSCKSPSDIKVATLETGMIFVRSSNTQFSSPIMSANVNKLLKEMSDTVQLNHSNTT